MTKIEGIIYIYNFRTNKLLFCKCSLTKEVGVQGINGKAVFAMYGVTVKTTHLYSH